jgi:Domain of unknown function (DUF4398)
MNNTWKRPGILLFAVPLASIGACASSPDRPFQDLARAEASIEQADQSGAQEYGATELDSARDKLAKARAAADSDENVAASRYAKEAAVDAELATAMTRERKAELAVEELNRSIETLREEIARNQARSGERQ